MDMAAADSNANYRHTFERYLHDYLIKRNMHQTAENFRNEANLQLDPNDASSN
ncbi:LIS1-like proteiny motif [Sesbania bispinosa]|nr:LIS1-like proteiny motif [Sesbania bispinosa]